jgi:hypothetical protein
MFSFIVGLGMAGGLLVVALVWFRRPCDVSALAGLRRARVRPDRGAQLRRNAVPAGRTPGHAIQSDGRVHRRQDRGSHLRKCSGWAAWRCSVPASRGGALADGRLPGSRPRRGRRRIYGGCIARRVGNGGHPCGSGRRGPSALHGRRGLLRRRVVLDTFEPVSEQLTATRLRMRLALQVGLVISMWLD